MKARRAQVESLRDKISVFLIERRLSKGGGYAEVTDKDIQDLYEIIEDLVDLKCDRDGSWELPIEVQLINRRTHQRSHYEAVPYSHQDIEGHISRAELNFDIAFEAYKTARKVAESYRKKDSGK